MAPGEYDSAPRESLLDVVLDKLNKAGAKVKLSGLSELSSTITRVQIQDVKIGMLMLQVIYSRLIYVAKFMKREQGVDQQKGKALC